MPLSSCFFFNSTQGSEKIVYKLKEDLAVPSMVIQCVTLLLSVVSLIALVSSRCFRTCSALFYFNLTVADAIMAFLGIAVLAAPSSNQWSKYEQPAWIFYFLRFVQFLKCYIKTYFRTLELKKLRRAIICVIQLAIL